MLSGVDGGSEPMEDEVGTPGVVPYAGYETLWVERRGAVAWVTLDRPEVMNAFDEPMIRELHRCWRQLRGDDAVHAVVLTASGDRAFCTGIDRSTTPMAGADAVPLISFKGETPMHFDDPGEWISPKSGGDLWKPVVAAVNGVACGGAFYLLAEADIIVAADTATFFDPHTTYGMAAVFEPMAMLQRMPLGEVLRMSLLGAHERMTAQRAHQIGMVQEVVPLDQLHQAAAWVADRIASQPPLAVQATVRAVWYAQELGYRQARDVAKTLVALGTDEASLAAGQGLFASGTRITPRLR